MSKTNHELLPPFGQNPSSPTPSIPEEAMKPFGPISFVLPSSKQLAAIEAQRKAISEMPSNQASQQYLKYLDDLQERIIRAINDSD